MPPCPRPGPRFRPTLAALEDRVVPAGPDVLEPASDARATAPELGRNGSADEFGLSIHSAADVDWLAFRLSLPGAADSGVRIEYEHAFGDINAELYDQAGTLLGTSAGATGTESFGLSGRPAGTYFVRVTGAAGVSNHYDYRLVAPTDPALGDLLEPNNSPAEAYTWPALTDRFEAGGLNLDGTPDWFRVRLAGPGAGTAYFRADYDASTPLADRRLTLYAADLSTPVRATASGATWDQVRLAGLPAGDYFVRVDSPTGRPGVRYRAAAHLPAAVPVDYIDASAPNDSRATAAGQGSVAGTVSYFDLSIHSAADQDYFRFRVMAPTTTAHSARIEFTHARGDLDLQLLDATGKVIRSSAGVTGVETVSLSGLVPGQDYFLRVFGFGGAVNDDYTLTATAPLGTPDAREPNNTRAAATSLLGQSGVFAVGGLSVHTASDEDWFRFELATPGKAGHQVAAKFAHAAGDIDIYLHNAAGQELRGSYGVTDAEAIRLDGLAAGTYFLRVVGFGGPNPAYDLAFDLPVRPSRDPHEANDSAPAATPLALSTTGPLTRLLASVHTPADQDWYRFTTSSAGVAGHAVRVDFRHADGDVDLELFAADGTTRLQGSYGVTDAEQVSLDGLPAGTYLARVLGFAGATNPRYSLTITARNPAAVPADAKEPNNAPAEATVLQSGAGPTLVGAVAVPALTITAGDADFFRFTTAGPGTAAHSVRARFAAAEGALRLELLTPAGAVLATGAGTADGAVASLGGRPAGEYLVRVTGATGAVANRYALEVDAPAARDAWTVMVYLTASNLEPHVFADVNELERAVADLPGSVNVAVFWDQSSRGRTYPTGNGAQPAWGTAGRAILTGDTDPAGVATPFELLGEQNSGDPATLLGFVEWAARVAPADRYALIFGGHGSGLGTAAGAGGANLDDRDDVPADSLRASEIRQALLAAGVRADLLGFDNCLMGMGEWAYQLRDVAGVYAASQDEVAPDGRDYAAALRPLGLTDPSQVTPEQLADGLVSGYHALGPRDTYTASRASRLGPLAARLAEFAAAVGPAPADPVVAGLQAVRQGVTHYRPGTNFHDLGEFMGAVTRSLTLPRPVRDAAEAVRVALREAVVVRVGNPVSTGLSLLMPAPGQTGYDRYPGGADEYGPFLQATGWGAVVAALTRRRDGRPGVDGPDPLELNDTLEQPADLGLLTGSGQTVPALNLAFPFDEDFFAFATAGPGGAADRVRLTSAGPEPVRVRLLDAAGAELAAREGTGDLQLPLTGRPAGGYRVHVAPVNTNPSGPWQPPVYDLVVDAPAGDRPPAANDTVEKALDLGLVTGTRLVPGQTLPAGPADHWFAFRTPRSVTPLPYTLRLVNAGADPLTLELRDAAGAAVVATKSGPGVLTAYFTMTGSAVGYTIRVTNWTGRPVSYTLQLTPTPPPAVQAVAVNGGDAQRSRVTALEVTFSAEVTLADGAFGLTGVSPTGAALPAPAIAVATRVENGRATATLTFSGANAQAGSLADGVWVLRVDRAKVTAGPGGPGMAADFLTPAAGTRQDGRIHRLFGDANGDGVVDFRDYQAFDLGFGLAGGDTGWRPEFDANGDGVVDFRDYQAFDGNFGAEV